MSAFAIGVVLGWLTAAAVLVLRNCWPTPGKQEPRDSDSEESGW